MIASLTGKILNKKPTEVLLDVNGVGYLVHITVTTFEKLPDEQQLTTLSTYLNVKEDALELYGFMSPAEKEVFRLLISVSGVGCKSAQSILSGVQIEDLREAIGRGNVDRLVAIPGIGKKTAERLIVELRDKIESIGSDDETAGEQVSVKQDALNALVNLGYSKPAAERTVRQILSEHPDASIEELIKLALSGLNK